MGRLTRLVIAACLAVPSLCQAQSPIGHGYQALPGDPDPGTKMVCALYSGSAHDKRSITSPTVALVFGQASPDTLVAVVFQPKWAFRVPTTLHGSIRLFPSGGGSADVQAYGNQAVLPLRLNSPGDLAALKASLMQADTMSITVDDAWHTHIKVSLAGIGPRLDGLITCAHQLDPTFPQSVPDPDRVRLGDWIGIKADDQGGRSCRVEATDGDRTLIIVNFLSGESAGRTGFSIRKRGWTFPDGVAGQFVAPIIAASAEIGWCGSVHRHSFLGSVPCRSKPMPNVATTSQSSVTGTNSAAYDAALRQLGRLTVWFTDRARDPESRTADDARRSAALFRPGYYDGADAESLVSLGPSADRRAARFHHRPARRRGDLPSIGVHSDVLLTPGPSCSFQTSFTADGAYDQDGVYGEVIARHSEASVVVPPRSSAVPSDTAQTAPMMRDSHLQISPSVAAWLGRKPLAPTGEFWSRRTSAASSGS